MSPLKVFKLLSDDTRLQIVLLLKGCNELCVCDIYTALHLSQPKVSRHLAMLRESGLILDKKVGKWVHYRLSHQIPVWVYEIIQQAFFAQPANSHCMKYIQHHNPKKENCTDPA